MDDSNSNQWEITLESSLGNWFFWFACLFLVLVPSAVLVRFIQGEVSFLIVLEGFGLGLLIGSPLLFLGGLCTKYLRIEKNKKGQTRAFIGRYLFCPPNHIMERRFKLSRYDKIKISLDEIQEYKVSLSSMDSDFIVFRTMDDEEMKTFVNRLKKITRFEITR